MLKAALAGALTLAVMGSSVANAGTAGTRVGAVTPSGSILTLSHVGRLKANLRLSVVQEPYWRPVEAVLRDMIQRQATVDATAVRRVMAVAWPLLNVLSDEQKQHAMGFAQSLGLTTAALAL